MLFFCKTVRPSYSVDTVRNITICYFHMLLHFCACIMYEILQEHEIGIISIVFTNWRSWRKCRYEPIWAIKIPNHSVTLTLLYIINMQCYCRFLNVQNLEILNIIYFQIIAFMRTFYFACGVPLCLTTYTSIYTCGRLMKLAK